MQFFRYFNYGSLVNVMEELNRKMNKQFKYIQQTNKQSAIILTSSSSQSVIFISPLPPHNSQHKNNTKMSLIRCRRHTCKIIIVTSLVWCLVDMLILFTYSDCSNGVGFGCTNSDSGKKGSIKFSKKVSLDSHGREIEEYSRSKLRSWSAAKVVTKQKGFPGEMGKAVQIPSDR